MTEKEIRKSLSGYKGIQSIREIELLRLLDEKDAQIAALSRTEPLTDAEKRFQQLCEEAPGMLANGKKGLIFDEAALCELSEMLSRTEPTAQITDGPSEVESVIACLLDDATEMFIENPFDEVAENMQKAADMLSRAAPPAQPTAQASAEPQDEIACDYCGAETVDPWHGSGLLNGAESKHIHACDACKDKLPMHGHTLAASAAPAAASAIADPLQELADQAHALDMGYAPNACPTCGKSVSAAPLTLQQIAQGFKSYPQYAYGAFEDGVRFAEKSHGIATIAPKEPK